MIVSEIFGQCIRWRDKHLLTMFKFKLFCRKYVVRVSVGILPGGWISIRGKGEGIENTWLTS